MAQWQDIKPDPLLFVYHIHHGTVVLLLYVDDIILTGSSSQLIDAVIIALTKEFDMKDLGHLHYFLGLQITYQPDGLFVSQTKYIKDMLEKFMHNPMDSHVVAVKRILRYLSGTLHYGLQFQTGKLQLQAYSDADWAGDPNDRRSTSGHIVYFGLSPISWASKK
ncbi:uncharacterized mitochondrial protein AtMg00810-like [Malus domestica]|uniref:uncharacterized mitochondrial protein AtMg00810-like n=1 Tax=Malus domestica TaxID=3750 RepID=UPI0010AA120C|nr:uncharacterized protein LOC108169502 [Malus domestica]